MAPAKVDGGVPEAELATIRLTPRAEERLGIQTVPLRYANVQETRTYAGEVIIPPGQSITVTAPVAGRLVASESYEPPRVGELVARGHVFFRLLPLERDLRGRNLLAEAEQELAASEVRVQAAELNHKRAEQLLKDKAGSVRALEQAQTEL
jgi:hypothetical protein